MLFLGAGIITAMYLFLRRTLVLLSLISARLKKRLPFDLLQPDLPPFLKQLAQTIRYLTFITECLPSIKFLHSVISMTFVATLKGFSWIQTVGNR
jgi:hypothetical protein